MRSDYDGAPIRLRDALGLSPADQARRAARSAILGDPYAPPVKFGLSSTRIFKPRISLAAWAGRRRADRRLPIYNLFNRAQPPAGSPYSVRVSSCRDFMGGQWTYDSHAGTDFACPVGTPIAAGAPGMVVRVARELDRGGLDVCVDHGAGLLTTHSHLSRCFVREGQVLGRGEVIGLSGAAGLEFVLFFPMIAPHLHYNTWVGGAPSDPFAIDGEVSLWREGNDPVPTNGASSARADAAFVPSAWNADAIDEHIDAIRDDALAARVRAFPDLWRQAAEVMYCRVFRGPVFSAEAPSVYAEPAERSAVLDLPFRRDEVSGVVLPPVG